MVTCRSWAFFGWALSLSLGFGVLISWPARLVAQTSVALPKELQSVALPNDVHIVDPQAGVPLDLVLPEKLGNAAKWREGWNPSVCAGPISLWYAICSTREKTAFFILTSAR